MTIRMRNLERLTLAEMKEFVTTNRHVNWSVAERAGVYELIERVLKAQHYRRLSKGQKGVVKSFLSKVTAVSRAVDSIDPALDGDQADRQEADAAAEFPATIYGRRYHDPGRGRCSPRGSVGSGSAAPVPAGLGNIWGGAVPAISGDLGLAYLQSAPVGELPQDSGERTPYAGAAGVDRGAAPARSQRAGRVSARGYGSSRTARRPTGCVPHQRGGHGDAVAGGGLHGDDQRTAFDSGAGSDVASVPFPDPGLPLRQRLGVSQSHGGQAAEQTAGGGVHQITRLPDHRQRFGGRQERSGGAQADRLRPDRQRARRSAPEVLRGLLQPVPELPSSLRIRYGDDQCARQAQTDVSPQRLSDALREADVSAGMGEKLETRNHCRGAAEASSGQQRHRCRAADAKSQAGVIGPLPQAAMKESAVEMPGLWKAWKAQRQASHAFHEPLGNLANGRRDSHIPTAPATKVDGKVENQKQVFHFPTPSIPLSQNRKPKTAGLRPALPKPNERRLRSSTPGRNSPLSFRLVPHWNGPVVSGSSRVGISFRFQAHFWIGKC